jgi:hypothetical protein
MKITTNKNISPIVVIVSKKTDLSRVNRCMTYLNGQFIFLSNFNSSPVRPNYS